MNAIKLRNLLVTLHLYGAALLAHLFLLVAVSGGLHHAGIDGTTKETPLVIPEATSFNPKSPSFEADVRSFLKAQNVDLNFEYVRARGDSFTTRPTSRTHVSFDKKDGKYSAKILEPSPLYALLEIHKGHGPRITKIYGWIAGLALFLVVIGGLVVGLLSPAYRKPTIYTTLAGTALFGWVAFIA